MCVRACVPPISSFVFETISQKNGPLSEEYDKTERATGLGRGDRLGESNDSPEIPDRMTLDMPGLPSEERQRGVWRAGGGRWSEKEESGRGREMYLLHSLPFGFAGASHLQV